MSQHLHPHIVLASTSRYRGDLLRRLSLDFEQCAPDTDETPRSGEPPAERSLRLARAKAASVAADQKDAIVIGSDQVADLDGDILRKPGNVDTARAQLARCSQRSVSFHTGLCVMDTHGEASREYTHMDTTRVHFRPLDEAAIARYIAAESPLDCAGSFKCEGLGVTLFERIENEDPTALIGLPLIALARLLRTCGITLP